MKTAEKAIELKKLVGNALSLKECKSFVDSIAYELCSLPKEEQSMYPEEFVRHCENCGYKMLIKL